MGFLTSSIIASVWIIAIFWRWDVVLKYLFSFFHLCTYIAWFLVKLVEFTVFAVSCFLCYEGILYFIHLNEERKAPRIKVVHKQKIDSRLISMESADRIEEKLQTELSSHWESIQTIRNELGRNDECCWLDHINYLLMKQIFGANSFCIVSLVSSPSVSFAERWSLS